MLVLIHSVFFFFLYFIGLGIKRPVWPPLPSRLSLLPPIGPDQSLLPFTKHLHIFQNILLFLGKIFFSFFGIDQSVLPFTKHLHIFDKIFSFLGQNILFFFWNRPICSSFHKTSSPLFDKIVSL